MNNNNHITKEEFDKFSETEREIRHDQNNKIQKYLLADVTCPEEKEVALIKQSHNFMKEKVESIEALLKDFIESVDHKFATKDEHKTNQGKIEKIDELVEKLKNDNTDFKIMIAKWGWVWMTISVIVWFIINKVF